MIDCVGLPQDWRETHDNAGQSALDMLVGVGDQLLDARQEMCHDDCFLDRFVETEAEVLHLVTCGGAYLGLAVLQQGLKCGNLEGQFSRVKMRQMCTM